MLSFFVIIEILIFKNNLYLVSNYMLWVRKGESDMEFKYKIIDTHAHYDDEAFDEDRKEG